MAKIIGIVGSRSRNNQLDLAAVTKAFLTVYKEGDWICSGGCPTGADRFAKIIHEKLCTPYLEFPANWQKYGRKAGPIRNSDIAKVCEILIACVRDDSVLKNGSRTSGTEDTVSKFKKLYPDRKIVIV